MVPTSRRATGVMKGVLLTAALLLSACARTSEPPAPDPVEGERKAALEAVTGYMNARKELDLDTAYKFVSEASQQLYTQEEFVAYYEQFPAMEWKRIGPVELVDSDWARIVVYDITVTYRDGQRNLLADFPYYVQKSGSRWGVAMINPMLGKLESDSITAAQRQALFDSLMKVNPYSTSLHTALYYTAVDSGDTQQAQEALQTLYEVGGPSDLANLQALRAHFFLNAGVNGSVVSSVELALRLSESYPERYDDRWRAGLLVTGAKAHIGLGESSSARQALERAIVLDPRNQEAPLLLKQLGTSKS